jgi:Ca2+-binding EF-hand superfamily protein
MSSPMSRSHSHTNNVQASTNYKEAFALFDKRGNGRVALESLGDLLRACGQNPTIAEVRELEKGVGGDCELCPLFYQAVLVAGVAR